MRYIELGLVSERYFNNMMSKFAILDEMSKIYDDDICLVFKNVSYISPAVALIILAIRDTLKQKGKRLFFRANELKENEAVLNFFLRSGLNKVIAEGSRLIVEKVRNTSHRVSTSSEYFAHCLDLVALNTKSQSEISLHLLSEAQNSVKAVGSTDTEFVYFLISKLIELLNNAAYHSKSEKVYIMAAQDNHQGCILAVYDRGIGIPGAYDNYAAENNKPPLKDEEAIQWALQRGNSTQQNQNGVPRGVGLFTIHDQIDKCQGWMAIASRKGTYFYGNQDEVLTHMSLALTGTMILIRIPANFRT